MASLAESLIDFFYLRHAQYSLFRISPSIPSFILLFNGGFVMSKLMITVLTGVFVMGVCSVSFAGMFDQLLEATEKA